MRRPLSDKRPIGPFSQFNQSRNNRVLITTDFGLIGDKDPDFDLTESALDTQQRDIRQIVEDVGDDLFFGEIADVRIEDHAVDGERGIRAVYNTGTSVIFKAKIDVYEKRIKQELNERKVDNPFGKITVVAST